MDTFWVNLFLVYIYTIKPSLVEWKTSMYLFFRNLFTQVFLKPKVHHLNNKNHRTPWPFVVTTESCTKKKKKRPLFSHPLKHEFC